jgi:hypothetical protein
LDLAGLNELAATLPLMAVDDEHHTRAVVGFITNPRTERDALLIDGLIYARRFPEIARGIADGTLKLSVEAFAAQAKCSTCQTVFASEDTYCEHLQARHTNGTTRWLTGLKGVGAGVTANPAGTSTHFDTNAVTFLASLDLKPAPPLAPGPDTSAEAPPDCEPANSTEDNMELEELKAAVADLTARLEAQGQELATANAALATLTTTNSDLQAQLQATDLAHARALDLLDAGFSKAEVQSLQASLAGTNDAVLALLKTTKQATVATPAATEPGVAQSAHVVLGGDNDALQLDEFAGLFA